MNGVKKENNNRSKASTIKLDNLKSNQKKIVNTLEKKDFLGKKQQSDKAKKQESPINTIVEDLKKTRPLTKKIKQVTISQSGEINMKESGVNKLQHEKDLNMLVSSFVSVRSVFIHVAFTRFASIAFAALHAF